MQLSIVTSPPSHPVGSCERFWLAARRVPVVATSSGPSLRGAGDVELIIGEQPLYRPKLPVRG